MADDLQPVLGAIEREDRERSRMIQELIDDPDAELREVIDEIERQDRAINQMIGELLAEDSPGQIE
ncbi:MAG: hypothetical protein HUJ26_16655 [Planctomycetaceae bacterium]|nr:hypothetical protein [Planctomycetaceae bacterium]